MQLQQWVAEPTRGANILDLVLTRHLQCSNINVKTAQFITDHKEPVADVIVHAD